MSTKMTADHHHVKIDFGKGDWNPTLSLTCSAPADTWCRAEWECNCEEFSWSDDTDGKPTHTTSDDVEHVGAYGAECSLVEWFDGSDEMVRGSVSVPVKPQWDGDGYEFPLSAEATP